LTYPTDPLLSFHLAAAIARLHDGSPLKLDDRDGEDNHQKRMYEVARLQFKEWIEAFRLARDKVTLRFEVADCFAFCYTLRHADERGERCAHWYRARVGVEPLVLGEEYGRDGTAPKKFDVVDTATRSDQAGILNLLVAAKPLLKDAPSSTLYTDTAHAIQDMGKYEELLLGRTTTLSTLLGLYPITGLTASKPLNAVDEILTAWQDPAPTPQEGQPEAVGTEEKKESATHKSYGFRLAWKLADRMVWHGQDLPGSLEVKEDDLLVLANKLYFDLFEYPHKVNQLPEEAEQVAHLKKGKRMQYHAGSFAAILTALCKHTQVDPYSLVSKLEKRINGYWATVAGLYENNVQQLLAEFLLTMPAEVRQTPINRPSWMGLYSWKDVPPVVAVTIAIPWEHWSAVMNRTRIGDLAVMNGYVAFPHKDKVIEKRVYCDIQIAFGEPVTQGKPDEDDFAIAIDEQNDQEAKCPMIVTFNALTEDFRSDGYVGFRCKRTRHNTDGSEEETQNRFYEYRVPIISPNVHVSKFRPGQTGHKINETHLQGWAARATALETPSPDASFPVTFDDKSENITMLTGHLSITSDKGKELLAAKVPIVLQQFDPFTINIAFGKAKIKKDLILPLTFPAPVTKEGSKTRIARTSGYIEIDAPMVKTMEPVLDDYILPTTLYKQPSTDSIIPVTLNTPHINLDTLPILALDDKSRIRFLTTLTSLTFSSRDRQLREEIRRAQDAKKQLDTPPPARLNIKESLFTMFMLASGLQGGQTGLFTLTHPKRGGNHMLFLVSAIRLDPAHGSVVLDAAVLPVTTDLISEHRIDEFLVTLRAVESCTLTVDDAELEAWKKMLPALAERCRTWEHDREKCEYIKTGNVPISLKDGDPVLCSCGMGKLPEGFSPLPLWDDGPSKYATRIAISPVYATALVEKVVDPLLTVEGLQREERKKAKQKREWEEEEERKEKEAKGEKDKDGDVEMAEAGEEDDFDYPSTITEDDEEYKRIRCWNCGKMEGEDGVTLKRCLRCLEARYCSSQCQKKDWKKHKMECEEADVYHQEEQQQQAQPQPQPQQSS